MNVEVRGPEGTVATVTANGTTKTVTLDDEEYRNVVVDAPAKLTSTVTVTAKVGDETVERTLTVGDGKHAADRLEAQVGRTSALGTAELTVWGMPTGIGGLTATEDGRRLALGAIKADGEGSLSLSGLAKGDHMVTVAAGGEQIQVSFHI